MCCRRSDSGDRRAVPKARRFRGAVACAVLATFAVQCSTAVDTPAASTPAASTSPAKGVTKLPSTGKKSGAAVVDIPPPATCTIGEKPQATALADVPRLDKCIAQAPDEWPDDQLPPDAMDTALGFRETSGEPPKAWHDGDAAVLSQGLQGTGHVETDVMLHLPQAKGTSLTVEVVRQVWYDCTYHHESPAITVKLVPGAVPGWWVPQKSLRTIVNMPMHLACGRWIRFQLFVRIPAEDHWHAAACTLKMWVAVPILGEHD